MVEIYRSEFPADCEVVVKAKSDGMILLIVRHQRPDPVWLKKYARSKNSNILVSDEVISNSIMKLVRKFPGFSPSYYARYPKSKGGGGGSQERREKAIDVMISEGILIKSKLEKPVGRKEYGLYVAEGK